jgi:hypothetical protein
MKQQNPSYDDVSVPCVVALNNLPHIGPQVGAGNWLMLTHM